MDAPLQSILEASFARAGVELAPRAAARLHNYLKLLVKWNARINLCGARTERELLELHVSDGVAVLPHIPAGAVRLADVGSGAGFVAVVAAIVLPSLAVTALEPAHKKHAFLSAVRRELPLPNLRPLAIRIEDHEKDPALERYDVAVSRATWPLPEWLRRGTRLVHDHGIVLAMEGAVAHELPEGASRHEYALADRTRAIVVYHPQRA